MESDKFNNYEIAEISETSLNQLSKLEKSLSDESDKNIVLIAYQNKSNEDSNNR